MEADFHSLSDPPRYGKSPMLPSLGEVVIFAKDVLRRGDVQRSTPSTTDTPRSARSAVAWREERRQKLWDQLAQLMLPRQLLKRSPASRNLAWWQSALLDWNWLTSFGMRRVVGEKTTLVGRMGTEEFQTWAP